MNKSRFNKLGHFFVLLFILILLLTARRFLGIYPLIGAGLLLSFSILYAITAVVSNEGFFLYPVMLLGTLSYYLFLYAAKVPSYFYPMLSVPLVLILLGSGWKFTQSGKEEFSVPLYRGMLVTIIVFTFWVFLSPKLYFVSHPLVPTVTFFGFSIVYYLRYNISTKVGFLYPSTVFFSIAYLSLLYNMEFIPVEYYGLFLIGLCALAIYIGLVLHNSKGIADGLPFYVIGFILTGLAAIFSARSLSIAIVSMLSYSSIYWYVHSQIKGITSRGRLATPRERSISKAFLIIANVAAYISIILLIFFGFPRTLTNIVATLIYSLACFKIALDSKRTFLKTRNHYAYLSGIFFIICYFLTLFLISPFDGLHLNLVLSVPLVLVILIVGYLMQRRGRPVLSNSVIDTGYLAMVITFTVSFLGQSYSSTTVAILSGLYLASYLPFMVIMKKIDLLYAVVITFCYGYYGLLIGSGITRENLGLYFIPIGLIFMVVAFTLRKRDNTLAKIFYFAWFVFSFISIYLSIPFEVKNVYVASIWAISYLLMAYETGFLTRFGETKKQQG